MPVKDVTVLEMMMIFEVFKGRMQKLVHILTEFHVEICSHIEMQLKLRLRPPATVSQIPKATCLWG